MEREEIYIPRTREDLGIPEKPNDQINWDELFGDTPIYTLCVLVFRQAIGFPAYLLFNAGGQQSYPKWTNHFNPSSVLFTKAQRSAVIISNIGIAFVICGLAYSSAVWGLSGVIKYYVIPWVLVSHWVVLITYLQHTAPTLPRYRGKAWNFQRGAATTIDLDFLGRQGRFFLHDIAHCHVAHHFFPMMPFYHGAEATRHLKAFLGEHYNYSGKPMLKALWETYNSCQFVENEGEVLFYRNKRGEAARRPPDQYRVKSKSE